MALWPEILSFHIFVKSVPHILWTPQGMLGCRLIPAGLVACCSRLLYQSFVLEVRTNLLLGCALYADFLVGRNAL